MYLCLSMTTKWKDNDFYHKLPDDISRENSFVILSQPKLLDIKRFHYKVWSLDKESFKEVQKNLKLFGFK